MLSWRVIPKDKRETWNTHNPATRHHSVTNCIGTHLILPKPHDRMVELVREQRLQLQLGCQHHTLQHSQRVHPDRAAEGTGWSEDLTLQEVPRPSMWGKDKWQSFLWQVCPGGGPLQQVTELQDVVKSVCNIRNSTKEYDSWFQIQSAANREDCLAKQSSKTKGGGLERLVESEVCRTDVTHRGLAN